MAFNRNKYWAALPPWIILGAVVIFVPLFVFMTVQTLHRQKENTTRLLVEKGAALIRSFEAGARTGMMGMMGMGAADFQLQRLLFETAQQPDIAYLIVTNTNGRIEAHSDPNRIAKMYGKDLDLDKIFQSQKIEWRQVPNNQGGYTFEVFRRFAPTPPPHWEMRGRMGSRARRPFFRQRPESDAATKGQIIFVGLDMSSIEAARKNDSRHTVIMAVVLLLIGFAGTVTLFLAQAYRTTRSSLSRVQAFSDNVVESMPLGLIAVDPLGRVASFNGTAESILHIPAAKALGEKVAWLLLPPLSSLVPEDPRKQGRIISREIDYPTVDGDTIPLDVTVTPVHNQDEEPLGSLILLRDLTEIRNLETEVERSKRLASIGRLAAGVAHEIRNPLSSIKGFATYFKGRYQDVPEDQKTAGIMIDEVERLNRVIGQLLEFARPLEPEKKESSLQGLIRRSIKTIKAEAMKKAIDVVLELPDKMEPVHLDPDRINQVLLNLYLNAIQSMEGGGTLSVRIARDENVPGVVIVVRDTGAGIEEKDLERIFDPYFTTKPTGTGLGLAIVHNIMEAHGGDIKVESKRGKGTSVTLIIPDRVKKD
jgi:two-component system sensor histidine kinase HydH